MDTTRYDRLSYGLTIPASTLQITLNACMMIMIVKHQRKVDQDELVLNVKKDLVYLVNHYQESSLCVD